MPKRYRRTCLDAYPLRRERSQNYDNNNANPGFWSPLGKFATLFTEPWGEYSSGELSVAAAANWTFSGVTNDSITNGVNAISVPRTQSLANSYRLFHTLTQINTAKNWEIDFNWLCTTDNSTQDQHNLSIYFEDDGTATVGYGVILQLSGAGGNTQPILVGFRKANTTIGPTFQNIPMGLGDFRLTCDATKTLTLLQGTTVLYSVASGGTTTGSKAITIIRGVEQTFSITGGQTVGPISVKGNKT